MDAFIRLEQTVGIGDYGESLPMIDQLEGMTKKRFTALENVISIVSNPDRNLIDERVGRTNEKEAKSTR